MITYLQFDLPTYRDASHLKTEWNVALSDVELDWIAFTV